MTKLLKLAVFQDMFSYLEAVKKVADESVYARGLKLYLEGSVEKYTELTLDYWREYQVRGTELYLVSTPLIHLALSQNKHYHADKVIVELVKCNCPYFYEYGVCKHIVGVMANLEKEFNPTIAKEVKKQKDKSVDSILESMFEVESDRKVRRYKHNIESYLNSSGGETFWFDEILADMDQNYKNYAELETWMKQSFTDAAKTYEGELRIIRLIKQSWYKDSVFWWGFWLPFLDKLESNNSFKLYTALWKMILVGILKRTIKQATKILVKISSPEKKQILEFLQKEFPSQTKIYVDFAIAAEFLPWIKDHLDELDPLSLLAVSRVYPEYDQIERLILKQVKVWSDFLQPQIYTEMAKVFQSWLLILGRTEYYEMALKYVKDNHAKKRKLITMLEK